MLMASSSLLATATGIELNMMKLLNAKLSLFQSKFTIQKVKRYQNDTTSQRREMTKSMNKMHAWMFLS